MNPLNRFQREYTDEILNILKQPKETKAPTLTLYDILSQRVDPNIIRQLNTNINDIHSVKQKQTHYYIETKISQIEAYVTVYILLSL